MDNKKLSIPETKNLVEECLKDYNSSMTQGSVLIWNKETLENLHEESKQQAISNFHAKCVKKTEDFSQHYLQDLEKDIAAAFEELQEFFEMKFTHENNTINEALEIGRQMYNTVMDRYFKTHEFITPDNLETLHKTVSARAIQFCLETNVLLEDSHKLQLQEGMNLIFEKYEQQNIMNLQIEPAIGIDLGTTYSCVAVYTKGKIHIIPNNVGRNTTPSYVAFGANGKETVGEAAKSRAYKNPEATIFDAKRIIGRRFNDPNLQNDATLWPFSIVDDFGVPKILIGDKKLHPEEISAKLLRALKGDAETYLQREVTKAVITVPAYFTDGQRQATKDAGTMAGLEVLNIQNEPTAAAIAYKLQHYEGREKNVIIYDLGGGTFDVAVLQMSKGNINVLAVEGDTHLGGKDFDKNMMSTEQCEMKKIELGTAIVTNVIVDRIYGDIDLCVTVTREIFEEINDIYFKKTIEVVDKALRAAKSNKTQIDDLSLVEAHQSQRAENSLNLFRRKLHTYQPREALDVTPMSIGVEVHGGGFSIIIPKSTKFPVKLMERYKTAYNNQTSVQITIYQGEDGIAARNQHLGDFYLNGIPPRPAEEENVDVEMVINSQGILFVSAISGSTGQKSVSIIENKFRMGPRAIQRGQLDSLLATKRPPLYS
ncbi:Heat shock cognate 71 kDa protein [Orchesella cincta]|uniref:Heat shock cognate 71 kDa protein n=1 Tax=Orchesella cincta TaxID=48709 RepID=A0A1D2MB81_ORCCI|nr:Heat shock cognate 71 kDa protein [Orchesella cincta]